MKRTGHAHGGVVPVHVVKVGGTWFRCHEDKGGGGLSDTLDYPDSNVMRLFWIMAGVFCR